MTAAPPRQPEPGFTRARWEESPLAHELFTIHNLMMRVGDRFIAPLGLTSSRWLLLGALNHYDEPPTISQLSNDALLSVQNVSRMVGAMERDGLVERFTRPGRGRATFVRLTERGQEIRTRARAACPVFARWFLAGIDEDRLGELESDMHRLIGNLEALDRALEQGEVPLDETDE